MFPHAVADAAAAALNRSAQCFHIISARLMKRAWFGRPKAGDKDKDGNKCDGLNTHGVISVLVPSSLAKFKPRLVRQLKLHRNDITFLSSRSFRAKLGKYARGVVRSLHFGLL
jgi:hypothetical protein